MTRYPFGSQGMFGMPQSYGGYGQPWGGGYGQGYGQPRSFAAWGGSSYPGFDGSTQPVGNGMAMKQMGPSMLPRYSSAGTFGSPDGGAFRGTSMNQPMPQLPPGMGYNPTAPSRLPPNRLVEPTPQPDPLLPPDRMPPPSFTGGSGDFDENTGTYRSTGTDQPPGGRGAPQFVGNGTIDGSPGGPVQSPILTQPQRPNPSQFPGVPQHILSAITMDPSGRMLYGPDRSPVKFEGGKMVFDSTPFVPGQGQFGQYGTPGAGGFRLDTSSGRNMIVGGANGPQLYNAEGLVQGSQAPQNFVNYLNRYGQGMFR